MCRIHASLLFSFLGALMKREKPLTTPLLFCADKSFGPFVGFSSLPSPAKNHLLLSSAKTPELEGSMTMILCASGTRALELHSKGSFLYPAQ